MPDRSCAHDQVVYWGGTFQTCTTKNGQPCNQRYKLDQRNNIIGAYDCPGGFTKKRIFEADVNLDFSADGQSADEVVSCLKDPPKGKKCHSWRMARGLGTGDRTVKVAIFSCVAAVAAMSPSEYAIFGGFHELSNQPSEQGCPSGFSPQYLGPLLICIG